MRQGDFLPGSAIEYREVVGLLRLRERQSVGRACNRDNTLSGNICLSLAFFAIAEMPHCCDLKTVHLLKDNSTSYQVTKIPKIAVANTASSNSSRAAPLFPVALVMADPVGGPTALETVVDPPVPVAA